MKEIRCPKCNKLLLKGEGKGEVKCNRCKTIVEYDTSKKEIRERKS